MFLFWGCWVCGGPAPPGAHVCVAGFCPPPLALRVVQLLRMVDNDAIDPEEVDTIKDSIEFYIDCHHDADFQAGASGHPFPLCLPSAQCAAVAMSAPLRCTAACVVVGHLPFGGKGWGPWLFLSQQQVAGW